MNKFRSRSCRKCSGMLLIAWLVCVQSVSADEWVKAYEQQSGFSEFSPPAVPSYDRDKKYKKEWRSGSSFNEPNKQRYVPVNVVKNPWKPVNSMSYRKSLTSRRPWGNIPDRKRPVNNMKYHDQRFKQWIHQQYPSFNNRQYSQPFNTNYGYPGARYNNPIIAPGNYTNPGFYTNPDIYSRGVYPGRVLTGGPGNPIMYGTHPAILQTYAGLPGSYSRW